MTEHKVGTREEWHRAREELLQQEKELTRRGDDLARQRRELGFYPLLDRVPKGRDEGGSTEFWLRRHDEYEAGAQAHYSA
jgi:predicted dithiol-disulfide oxidoreductase (DUF899 family)